MCACICAPPYCRRSDRPIRLATGPLAGRLDTCVTVVDAYNFSRDYASRASLREQGVAAYADDARHVVDLLIDQVEFANVLVVNKVDLLDSGGEAGRVAKATLVASLRALNPAATIVESVRGAVAPSAVLNTRLFSMEAAAAAPGWLQELRGTHVPESAEYGIASFIIRAKRPFHPERLHALVYESDTLRGVLRSKGFFWLAVDGGMDEVALWGQAGRLFSFSAGRPWWVLTPEDEWPRAVRDALRPAGGGNSDAASSASSSASSPASASSAAAAASWDAAYGDRRQELVFIGCGMDRPAIEAALAACLLTDEEFAAGPDAWDFYDDPFDFYEYEGSEEGQGEGAEEGAGDDACAGGHGHSHGHGHGGHGHAHAHGHGHGHGGH